ncbi:replicative DNA helicase [Psychromicrobium lacuslunae]|uniref:replicative DNA helicase n=1 Tax=Psychromicrobium lacuslunae TaxID=1618207 RepID=UPI0005D35616|nr:replicative DNA helicase [Psychromicrobium lacuslunae]
MVEAQPLADLDAERSVLGSVMLSRSALVDVVEVVSAADFYRPAHEMIFTACLGLFNRSEPVDPVTVAAELSAQGTLHKCGDAVYLHELVQAVPTAASGSYYAGIVANKAGLRRLSAALAKAHQVVMSGADSQSALQEARSLVDSAVRTDEGSLRSMGETIDETLNDLSEPVRFTPTAWDDLSYLLGGWRPGAVVVIGARPGVGKTVVGLQSALDLTRHGNVLFASLEMTRNELQSRAIAQIAKVSVKDIDRRSLTDEAWDRVAKARKDLDRSLFIDDRSFQTITSIRSAARTVARKGPLAGVVVDYVQLISAPTGDRRSRQEQVAEISRGLKILSKELDVPVLALSQLNRQSESRTDKRPSIADLRETGALEQDADVVLLLHRDLDGDPSLMNIAVAKNRHGITGAVELTFEGAYSRITQRGWQPAYGRSN